MNEKGWEAGTFTVVPGVDEDIFTASERRLGEITGKNISGKLHIGRSRNKQVVYDIWLRDKLRNIKDHLLVSFLNAIEARAEQKIDYVMPGYTHFSALNPPDGTIGRSHTDSLLLAIWRGLGRSLSISTGPPGLWRSCRYPFGIYRDMITKELALTA